MKKKIWFLLTFWFICEIALSQDLIITYDVFKDSVSWSYKNKSSGSKTIPFKARHGKLIRLKVINYNNYVQSLDLITADSTIPIPTMDQNGFFANLIKSGITQKEMEEGTPEAVEPDTTVTKEALDTLAALGEESLGFINNNVEKAQEAMKNIHSELQNIQNIVENAIPLLQREVSGQKDDINERLSFLLFLAKLDSINKYRVDLPTDEIQKNAEEYLLAAFDVQDVSKIDFRKVVEGSSLINKIKENLKNLRLQVNRLENPIKILTEKLSELKAMDRQGNEDFQRVLATIEEALSKTKAKRDSLVNYNINLGAYISKARSTELDILSLIQRSYEGISKNPFRRNFEVTATGDYTFLNFNFSQKPKMGNGDSIVLKKNFKIPVFGKIKVNASLGVSFGQFFNRPQSYFVRGDTIRAQDSDKIYPVLTNFIHFYMQSSGPISIGGALGIGVPIASVDGLQSTTFFFGPSLLIGKGERVVINAGLMGGRVKRLSEGLKVNQRFTSEATQPPTHTPYELGLFLGVSYNFTEGGQN